MDWKELGSNELGINYKLFKSEPIINYKLFKNELQVNYKWTTS